MGFQLICQRQLILQQCSAKAIEFFLYRLIRQLSCQTDRLLDDTLRHFFSFWRRRVSENHCEKSHFYVQCIFANCRNSPKLNVRKSQNMSIYKKKNFQALPLSHRGPQLSFQPEGAEDADLEPSSGTKVIDSRAQSSGL